MSLDDELLEILVCPKSKEPLIYFEEEDYLFCPASKLKYEVKDDIPVMLVDEADSVSDEEAERIMEIARENNLENSDESIGTAV